MKFKDFAIGDWFYDPSEQQFIDNAIFIKIDDTTCCCVNIVSEFSEKDIVDPDDEFEFVSNFIFNSDDAKEINMKPFNFTDFTSPSFLFVSRFNDLPIGCVYKGKGQTYYKRISNNETLVVWSPNYNRMGQIFTRDDWETHEGHYYICNNGWYVFPEKGEKYFPYTYNPNIKFSF